MYYHDESLSCSLERFEGLLSAKLAGKLCRGCLREGSRSASWAGTRLDLRAGVTLMRLFLKDIFGTGVVNSVGSPCCTADGGSAGMWATARRVRTGSGLTEPLSAGASRLGSTLPTSAADVMAIIASVSCLIFSAIANTDLIEVARHKLPSSPVVFGIDLPSLRPSALARFLARTA